MRYPGTDRACIVLSLLGLQSPLISASQIAINISESGHEYRSNRIEMLDLYSSELTTFNQTNSASDSWQSNNLNTALSNRVITPPNAASVMPPHTVASASSPSGVTQDTSNQIVAGTKVCLAQSIITSKNTEIHRGVSEEATSSIQSEETPSLVVNTNGDSTDPLDGVTTLREAIAFASSGNAGPAPVITFAPGIVGKIDTTAPAFLITHDMTIVGPGADVLAISGNDDVNSAKHPSPMFDIRAGTAKISGLTLTDGTGALAIGPTITRESPLSLCAAELSMSVVEISPSKTAIFTGILHSMVGRSMLRMDLSPSKGEESRAPIGQTMGSVEA
jgi:hypothetical protein